MRIESRKLHLIASFIVKMSNNKIDDDELKCDRFADTFESQLNLRSLINSNEVLRIKGSN